MFLQRSDGFDYGRPQPSGTGGIGTLYRQLAKLLGFDLLIPLFVGEVVQYIWMEPVKKIRLKFRLNKVASFLLLIMIWSTFSGAFYSGVFTIISTESVIFMVFVNIGLYLFFLVLCFTIARFPLPDLPAFHVLPFRRKTSNEKTVDQLASPSSEETTISSDPAPRPSHASSHEPHYLFSAEIAIALSFCAPAKGIVIGEPIVETLYGGLTFQDRSIIQVPLVLYQGLQVAMGQVTVMMFQAWMRRLKAKQLKTEMTDANKDVESTPTGEAPATSSPSGLDEEVTKEERPQAENEKIDGENKE